MHILIIKLGATGDVVRTTPLLRRFEGQDITWLTASKNKSLIEDRERTFENVRALSWEDRHVIAGGSFDLTINLEDDPGTAAVLNTIKTVQLFGAFADSSGKMQYTESAAKWFDLSLLSTFGREKADELKFQNRQSYQDLIFNGLGFEFKNEKYLLPATPVSKLKGDVAIAPEAGPVWPMKQWAHYEWLKCELERRGASVNLLPLRPTLLEHLADVRGHRCLVSGDSLPMHLAVGSGLPSVALFNCTSPWEIHDYGILTKFVSPLLGEFFYKREFDVRATTAISRDEVLGSVLKAIGF